MRHYQEVLKLKGKQKEEILEILKLSPFLSIYNSGK